MTGEVPGLGAWLEAAGLEALAPVFAANDIDLDVLRELSEEDLKELGLNLGQRRRLQKALRGPAAEEAGSDTAPAPATTDTDASAERRHVTVMFVDLVGSTRLAARTDPEVMAEILSRFQDCVSGVVARCGGHIAKFMGDGVLIYFGWPRVREDEVEVALRAGLLLLEAVARQRLDDGSCLAVRIGCASGWVVIGDLIGDAESRERRVVGDTPNLAARLQSAAEPGQFLVSEASYRLAGAGFLAEALQPLAVKGYDAPVAAYRILRERPAASRYEARSGRLQRRPLVGRENELALMLRAWELALGGEGQTLVLVGEAGIGKSRVTDELLLRAAETPHRRIRFQCSPYFTDQPLWPLAQQVRRAARLDETATPEAQDDGSAAVERLTKLIALGNAEVEVALPAFADLVELPLPGAGDFQALPSARRRELTQQTLIEHVLGLAAAGPVLIVLEDAHWADPSTLELFELLLEATSRARVMALITSRPEGEPRLALPSVARLALSRLDRHAVSALIRNVMAEKGVPEEEVAQIVERTDGIPLFIEELTMAVIEARQDASADAAPIPASLHDSLMARLDRLPGVREVAQVAACIGREFDRGLLVEVAPQSPAEIDAALQRLIVAELIFRRGRTGSEAFVFKHALVRDAAHASLLKSRCRAINAAIVRALEARADTAPALIGQHAAEAGDIARAVDAFETSGREALRRGANEEAIRVLGRAFDLVPGLPEAERETAALRLQVALSVPLIAARGYAAPEVEKVLTEALARAKAIGREEDRYQLMRGLWNCVFDLGELPRSADLAESLVELAEASGRGDWLRLAYRALGSNRMNQGHLRQARRALESVLGSERPWSREATLFEHGEDPEMISRLYLAWITTVEGRVDTGLALIHKSIEDALKLPLPIAGVFARSICTHIQYLRRDFAACRENAAIGLAVAEEQGIPFWAASLKLFHGWSGVHLGEGMAALEEAKAGVLGWKATGAKLHVSTWNAVAADAALHLGQAAEAAELIDEALQIIKRTGEGFMISDILRLNARRQLEKGDAEAAEAALREALAKAEVQGARWFRLRAAVDLVRMHGRHHPSGAEARAILADALRSLDEGATAKDVREAAELLIE